MTRLNERRQELTRVTGFLVPEFTETLPDGRTLNGVTERAFGMIQEGYACGECLAMFDRFTIVCPVCKLSRDISALPQQAPQLWLDHLEERYADIPHEKPAVVNPFAPGGADEAINAAMQNPDVEHMTMSQLTKKAKRRKG